MTQLIDRIPSDVAPGGSCPSEADLCALADGALDKSRMETIFQHLTACWRCESSFARLAEQRAEDSRFLLSDSVRAVLQEPQCQRLQEKIRDLPGRAAGVDREAEESTDRTRNSTDAGPRDSKPPAETTTAFVPQLPKTIGRYKVRSLLGHGGYGQVYLADDPDLDRQVAIKVAKGGPTKNKLLIDGFRREAKIAARLKHPGIVTVYDFDVDDQVGCYIVMEYVEGESLKEVIAAGKNFPERKISHQTAADYTAQAAEALAHAHKFELIHRDIKPSNLLLDKEGRIKVADFGLAIFEDEQRKHAGEIAGTLAYCSPEQLRGEVQYLDARTDIWSLGVVLYELLTGRRPFGGPNVTDEILHRPPKPPRQIDDSIPAALEQICLNSLSADTARRYSTAQDLAAALRSDRNPRPPAPSRHRKWRWVGGCIVAALLLVVAFAVGPRFTEALWELSAENGVPELRPATIPYDMDGYAEPGTWVRMLTQPPRGLFGTEIDPLQCLFFEKREEALVNSTVPCIVGLGTSQNRAFDFEMNVTKTSHQGSFGFLLGAKPSRKHPGELIAQFVLVTYNDSQVCCVERAIDRIIKKRDGRIVTLDHSVFAIKPVAALIAKDTRLEVTVRGGEIDRIAWRGEEFPALRGKLMPGHLEERVEYTDCIGEFGLCHFSGTTQFQSPRFRIR